jgi:hypothetical protein
MEYSKAMVQAFERVSFLGYFSLDATEHSSDRANRRAVRFGLYDYREARIEQEIIKRRQQAVQTAWFRIAGVLSAFHEPMSASRSVLR